MQRVETHGNDVPLRLAYSLAEAQELTSLSRTTLWRAIKAGKLKSTKCGTRRLIPAVELIAFVTSADALALVAQENPRPPAAWVHEVLPVAPPDRTMPDIPHASPPKGAS